MGDVFDQAAKGDVFDQAATQQQHGFLSRAAQSLGIPTSWDEAKALASPATIGGIPVAPGGSGAAAAINFGKNLYQKGKEFIEHPSLESGMHAGFALTPGGASQESFAQDITDKNYKGAAGTAVGTAAQFAAPEILERTGPLQAKLGATAGVLADPAMDAVSKLPFLGKVVDAAQALGKYKDVPGKIADIWGKQPASAEPASVAQPNVYRAGYRQPRAYYGGQPAEPIPQRGGLQLQGEVAQPIEGEYMPPDQTTPKPPLPFLRATPVTPRGAEPSPAPYRYGPGEIAPEDVNAPDPMVLAGKGGVRVPPQRTLALPADVSSRLPFLPKQAEPQFAAGPQQIQDAIQRGLGHEPIKLQPSIPLREQLPFTKSRTAPPPEPSASSRQSTAVDNYQYDPTAREFHIKPSGGNTTYIYGDVSPEDAAAFDSAESKGQAWQQMRNNTLVGKVVNGKRVAIKPVAPSGYDPNNLTDILTRSVRQVRK